MLKKKTSHKDTTYSVGKMHVTFKKKKISFCMIVLEISLSVLLNLIQFPKTDPPGAAHVYPVWQQTKLLTV